MFQKLATLLRGRINPALWLRTRYTRSLEEEVARLRAENRARVNSIVGVAGIPPMRGARVAASTLSTHESDQAAVKTLAAASNCVSLSSGERGKAAQPGVPSCADAPLRSMRRRSWQQIGRALEIEDARAAQRERATDTETFPAPRGVVPRV